MTDQTPRVVFDCNVFAQALISPRGPARASLLRAAQGHFFLFISGFVITEVRNLPQRLPPRLLVSPERVKSLLLEVAKFSVLISEVPRIFEYSRDPDDAHYIDLALAAGASVVVSRDKDLLDLMNPKLETGAAFGARFPGITILEPQSFLRWLDDVQE